MSAKRDPEDDDDDDVFDEGDYVNDDDDDDEEEDDFVPGMDEDEDEDEDDDESEIVPLLDGHLTLDADQKLHYIGEGFHLSSSEVVKWNILDQTITPTETTYTMELAGPCDAMLNPQSNKKAAPRKLQITWTVAQPPPSGSSNRKGSARLKSAGGDDDDDEDGKEAADSKIPATYYHVYGCEIGAEGDRLEFRGGYHPSDGKKVGLVCQVRMVSAQQSAVPVAAAAAAAAAPTPDDDDEVEGDEDVDVDELIALHEDAGVPVDALRKRYRQRTNNNGDDDDDDGGNQKKRGKSAPDDEDDDDDIAF